MKVLFIGGTGNISSASSRLAVSKGIDLYLLNRGVRKIQIEGAKSIVGDITKENEVSAVLDKHNWDVVVNWIGFNKADVERDIRLFKNKTKQYIFISSASAYQTPLENPVVTEETPLSNPYWDYSRSKIACEERLMQEWKFNGFPVTIVRPSHTYDTVIPLTVGGWDDYTIIERMREGKPIIVHGDGSSLWTVTHSEDFAKGFVGLLGHPQAAGEAFHITSDEILNWNQIFHAVAEAAGVELNIIHIPSDFIIKIAKSCGRNGIEGSLLGDKAVSVIFDNSKIKRYVPDFKADIQFNEGIKRTLAWFESDASRTVINDATNEFMDLIINTYNKAFESI